MYTFISLLRGINVSGQKLVPMAELRDTYGKLGFTNITTYIQSGNVVFSAKENNTEKIKKSIEKQISTDLGFEVPVLVLSVAELQSIINNNPFKGDTEKDTKYLHVSFFYAAPNEEKLNEVISKSQPGEELIYTKQAIYLYCPLGYGKSKLNNNLIESKLKVLATTRNWNSTNQILQIAQNTPI